MADEEEVEIRGLKRPLVENYSDDEEEEEARRKEGGNTSNGHCILIWSALKFSLVLHFLHLDFISSFLTSCAPIKPLEDFFFVYW